MKRVVFVFTILGLLIACSHKEDQHEEGGDNFVHVKSIAVDPPSVQIKEGEAVTLTATISPENASNQNITWSSSNNDVAMVEDGQVAGIKAGVSTITATAEDGGKTATCEVTVIKNLFPSVTVGADHVSTISVVLMGKANLGNSASEDLKVGFQYSKSAGILPSNSTTVEALDADSDYNYTTAITGLDPRTTYYFRSFVRQNGQDIYGETKLFTTKELPSMLCTQEATALSAVSAKLNASLDMTDVLCSNKTFGFYYGSNAESLTNNVPISEDNGALSAPISSLTPSTQYFFQAYAVLDGREFKEDVVSFTTKDLDSMLETSEVSNIEAASACLAAKLNLADVVYGSISYGFYWGESESSLTSYIKGGDISENAYSATLNNLSHNTQYWYMAYTEVDGQTFSGEVKTFTTDVVPVESVSLLPTEYTFHTIGSTLKLSAEVIPTTATDKSVTWASDKEDVASVNENGIVTARGNGSATITVTTKDQAKTASCAIVVSQYVTKITLDKSSLSLVEGESTTLNVTAIIPDEANDKTYSWTSSDASIATVDNTGKVTAVSKGNATITVTANDGSGVKATCAVEVKRPVSSITLDKTSITMHSIGNSEKITATVLPIDANNTAISWSSSNTSVATVTSGGNVKSVGNGEAIITATAKDGSGIFATCEVNVKQYVTGISLDIASLDLVEGQSQKVNVLSITPNNAYNKSISWTSLNESVVSVDADGVVTAHNKGKSVVRIAANDGSGISVDCNVVVSHACPSGAVDLGMTTTDGYKVYWASCNLGATSPSDYGGFYAWGETQTKSNYSSNTYTFKLNPSVLPMTADAASVQLGGNWRMPTDEEYQELLSICTYKWSSYNEVSGLLLTSSINGNSIFLPATGSRPGTEHNGKNKRSRIWSASISPADNEHAAYLYIDSDLTQVGMNYNSESYFRYCGLVIRPVCD